MILLLQQDRCGGVWIVKRLRYRPNSEPTDIASNRGALAHLKFRMKHIFIPSAASWPYLPPPVRHDLMMFQMSDVSLVPQADNPLPRMVLDVDLFNRAIRRGKLGVPGNDGSEIEERSPMELYDEFVVNSFPIFQTNYSLLFRFRR